MKSDVQREINAWCLNSPIRHALTGADQCSDRGMGMSHVFSIIYTAFLFLSQPLSQLSILLDRNQSAICQSLSILLLIYVSSCSWLQAAGDWEKGKWKRSTLVPRHLIRAAQSSCFIPFARKIMQNQMRGNMEINRAHIYPPVGLE